MVSYILGNALSNMQNNASAPSIECSNLSLGYERHPAVHHLNLTIPSGALLAIVGPNGAGKSTLLKGIAGELSPMQGSIRINGGATQRIAYLTQQSTLDPSFPISVFDLAAMGLWAQCGLWGGLDRAAHNKVHDALAAVGLSGLETRSIGTLSGGQLQRARFARALLQEASLVLLDEPYAAIDSATVRDLSSLVQKWHEEGRTIISVLHDLDHVRSHYPLALLLARESVAYGTSIEVMSEGNLHRAQHLAAALEANRHHICRRSPENSLT